jgi:transposase
MTLLATAMATGSRSGLDPAVVEAFRAGRLSERQAESLAATDPAELKFLFLQLSAAMAPSPHEPSGARAPWEKAVDHADQPKRRAKKRGAKPGHEGHARPAPEQIDHHVTHELPCCPDCQGPLKRTGRKRTRIIEDLADDVRAEATEHTIHRDWCPQCKKQVEPVVPDAMPACTIGHNLVTLAAYLHFGVGTSIRQVVDVFNTHLKTKISDGGLTAIWHRLATTFDPWYRQIHDDCLAAGVLHADETGWHLEGDLVWMWCFTTKDATFYMLHESRGHDAVDEFFTREFNCCLVTDFWSTYDKVNARLNQKCWAHLLREVRDIDDVVAKRSTDPPDRIRDDWIAFSKKLRRLYGDAMRLALADVTADARDHRVMLLHTRMADLGVFDWQHPDAKRLAKRLHTERIALLTFAEFPHVPPTNNHAEREIRPAVLMRKTSYGSASQRGMHTRAVLMTIIRTLKQRHLDPLHELRTALRQSLTTNQLPPLPKAKTGSGG